MSLERLSTQRASFEIHKDQSGQVRSGRFTGRSGDVPKFVQFLALMGSNDPPVLRQQEEEKLFFNYTNGITLLGESLEYRASIRKGYQEWYCYLQTHWEARHSTRTKIRVMKNKR